MPGTTDDRLSPLSKSSLHEIQNLWWTTVAEIAGTTFETIIVFWLWGTLWDKWTLPFKVVTPMLHVLFCAAQLFGAWVFWKLAKKEKSKMMAESIQQPGGVSEVQPKRDVEGGTTLTLSGQKDETSKPP
jgi:hypothetical protein